MRTFSQIQILSEFLITSELKTRHVMVSALLFLTLNMFIFYFSLDELAASSRVLAPGVLWLTYLYFATNMINNAYQRLYQGGFISGVFMSGVSTTVVFFSVMIYLLLMLLFLTLFMFLLFSLFFEWDMVSYFARYMAIFLISTFGVSASGVLLVELLSSVKMKEVLFPVLYLPINLPLFITSVRATLSNTHHLDISSLGFLIGINMILFFSSWLLYGLAKEELE